MDVGSVKDKPLCGRPLIQHPNKFVFSHTSLSLTKWQHLKHLSGSYMYTMQLELIQPPEELEEAISKSG